MGVGKRCTMLLIRSSTTGFGLRMEMKRQRCKRSRKPAQRNAPSSCSPKRTPRNEVEPNRCSETDFRVASEVCTLTFFPHKSCEACALVAYVRSKNVQRSALELRPISKVVEAE